MSEYTPRDRLETVLALESTTRHDDDGRPIVDVCTCGICGRSWNDAAISTRTPTPSGRCPFEYDHAAEARRPAPPARLSPDGRETLEDALRIFVETAGDDDGRRERHTAAIRLQVELGHLGVGALLTPPPEPERETSSELDLEARAERDRQRDKEARDD